MASAFGGRLVACCARWAAAMREVGELPAWQTLQQSSIAAALQFAAPAASLVLSKHTQRTVGVLVSDSRWRSKVAVMMAAPRVGITRRPWALGPELWAEVLKRVPESDRRVAAAAQKSKHEQTCA